jgi:hypothetical protein
VAFLCAELQIFGNKPIIVVGPTKSRWHLLRRLQLGGGGGDGSARGGAKVLLGKDGYWSSATKGVPADVTFLKGQLVANTEHPARRP